MLRAPDSANDGNSMSKFEDLSKMVFFIVLKTCSNLATVLVFCTRFGESQECAAPPSDGLIANGKY